MTAEPKILIWDIERTHSLAAIFQLFGNDYIAHTNLLQESYIPCACWKWLGEDKVHAVSTLDNMAKFKKDPTDDSHVVRKLHDVLSEADVIVAHNGDKFDIKFTEARMLYHGLSPLPPITKIDTLKVAKDRFLFNSNKLDYLARFLKIGKKADTAPELWLDVLKGDPKAIREMVKYNKMDVILLEKIFMRLRPYMANHINRELFGGKGCPRCGSTKVQSRGLHRAISNVYRRFQCQNPKCMGWFREVKAETKRATKRVL